ncbi:MULTISPECIES: hypothetical protein [unclassified Thermosipho (in: thermotogales)]|uniref:hypothetical protein n=1 Tax=unclassified Thermosipho (in: thermotogales) TaxID=2676525 RepID=UPI000985A35D|nr:MULTISPECIES: hypothetical protein [unclassified Thermosipho (in: thermotogales)]MBT1248077.1 hypothetical protein [Thermosipho sp. 1244]OOC46668.1 hypothetical protein XO09_05885 [Thermosipho sp. 1223]
MKKLSVLFLSILFVYAFSFTLNLESGYLYLDTNLVDIGQYKMYFPLTFSSDTKFDRTFYTKSALIFDQVYDSSYIYFEGDFYSILYPVPLTLTTLKEAYAEAYTKFGDIRVGKFIERLPDSEIFKVYDKVGKFFESEKLPTIGARYMYNTDFGSIKLNVFSNFVQFERPATYTYTVKTDLPDDSLILALLNTPSTPVLDGLKPMLSYGMGWFGNMFGVDYSLYLTYKGADYFVVDKISEEGLVVKRPFVFTISNSLVYQVPKTSFLVHNYLGFESGSVSDFEISVLGVGDVKIEEKVPSVLENVSGVEYQIGSNGLVGVDGYIKLVDLKYDSFLVGIYGNYSKDNFNVKGMVKYNLEDFDVLYELGYNFDDYTGVFLRSKWNKDITLVMVGLKSEI